MNTNMKQRLLIAAIAVLLSNAAFGQTFKTIFPTKLVMAGDTADPFNTLTMKLASNTAGGLTWVLPASNGTNGDVLGTDGNGNLSWMSPISIAINGDVTGTPDATIVSKINGATLGITTPTGGNMLIGNGTMWSSKALGGDATIDSLGALTLANSATTRTHLGLGSIATQNANNVSITGGTISGTPISGSTGSFTSLTVSGSVSLPAGSVTLGSMGLTDGHIIVGNSSGQASDVAMQGDAAITNTGAVAVNAVHTAAGPSIATAINNSGTNAINGENIKHDGTLGVDVSHQLGLNLASNNSWTGRQTMGSIAFTQAANYALSAGTNDNIDVSAANTFIRLTAGSGAATVTSINSPTAGRYISVVNADATNPITFVNEASTGTAANRIHSSAGNLILLPDGTATFIYDGTTQRWRFVNQ
jgi:hypothetical protein